MYTTLGAPSGAFGGSNGAQSGFESRMSTLMTPWNGLLIADPPDRRLGLRAGDRAPVARASRLRLPKASPLQDDQATGPPSVPCLLPLPSRNADELGHTVAPIAQENVGSVVRIPADQVRRIGEKRDDSSVEAQRLGACEARPVFPCLPT